MAFITLKAAEMESRQGCDKAGQVQGGLPRRHAASVHPDIHFDQDADRDAGTGGRGGEHFNVLRRIHSDDGFGAPSQFNEAGDFDWTNNLVCDENLADPAVSNDLRLTEFGASDADGA